MVSSSFHAGHEALHIQGAISSRSVVAFLLIRLAFAAEFRIGRHSPAVIASPDVILLGSGGA